VTYRISDAIAAKVAAAVESIPVLAVIRDEIGWEITPALMPGPGGGMNLAYMVAVSLPLEQGSVQKDHVLYMAPLADPDAGQDDVSALVYGLYERCQAEADERRAQARAQLNGHKESPGGLALP
jgi:hypothetical protein